jgi:hypothetical protein
MNQHFQVHDRSITSPFAPHLFDYFCKIVIASPRTIKPSTVTFDSVVFRRKKISFDEPEVTQ